MRACFYGDGRAPHWDFNGHHRISVARAMGQEHVEGDAMVWKLGAQPLCEKEEISPEPAGF
jgi:hypothetical protein